MLVDNNIVEYIGPNPLCVFMLEIRRFVLNNMISGHIPMSLGNLQAVESLDLSHNEISGSIPQTLDQLGKLTVLDVSNNTLTGKIPRGRQWTP
ncbi:leucine-rich repeat-containing protein [Tanacetum coccineum]